MLWIKLLAATGVITASGVLLTIYADRLGNKLGISGAFVGLIILSTISSLPELGTTISVVAYVGKPDLAAGNIFGSNTFNMLILAILDFALGSASLFALTKVSHNRSIFLAVLMSLVSVTAIMFDGLGSIAGYTLSAPLLLIIYIAGIAYLYLDEQKSDESTDDAGKEPLLIEILVVAGSGIVVVVAGFWLASISDEIVLVTGWDESFVGSLFLAVSTSLPELVITLSSLKLKAYDMAIANAVGSCFFNILMFAIADPLYDGELLADISKPDAILGLVSVLMLLTTFVFLLLGKRSKPTWLGKYILVAFYLLGSWLVFSPL